MQTYYQRRKNYLHRNIAGTNVLVSVGSNIANFKEDVDAFLQLLLEHEMIEELP